jgi:hypothetical protein
VREKAGLGLLSAAVPLPPAEGGAPASEERDAVDEAVGAALKAVAQAEPDLMQVL